VNIWAVERTEKVRFWIEISGDRRVVLSNGAGARVNSVTVTYSRVTGESWGEPSVSVSHGQGWHLTVTSAPKGLRGPMPAWLAGLVSEVRP
jgi:hypothetical protein